MELYKRRQMYCRISDTTYKYFKILATHHGKFDEQYLGEILEDHCEKAAKRYNLDINQLAKELSEENQ